MSKKQDNPPPVENAAPGTDAYEVLSPLEHDGVRYAIGERVQLTAAQAAPLLGHTVKAVVPDETK